MSATYRPQKATVLVGDWYSSCQDCGANYTGNNNCKECGVRLIYASPGPSLAHTGRTTDPVHDFAKKYGLQVK